MLVVFADATYFTRRYCAEELATGVAAYRALIRAGRGREELEQTLHPIVVALPGGGSRLGELERLPPELRNTNWPSASESSTLATLVAARLSRLEVTFGERLQTLGIVLSVVRTHPPPFIRIHSAHTAFQLHARDSQGGQLCRLGGSRAPALFVSYLSR